MKNVVIVLVILVLLGGGYFLVSNNSQKAPVENTPTNTQPVNESTEQTGESQTPSEAMVEGTTVTLIQNGFEPQSVTIKKGGKVVWINESGDTATVDSSKHPTHLDYPPLNLGQFSIGEKVELTFPEPGTYRYHDHLHPQRFGTVIVE